MQFQQIRSVTSIVTFGDKRFLIDPMLREFAQQHNLTRLHVPNDGETLRF